VNNLLRDPGRCHRHTRSGISGSSRIWLQQVSCSPAPKPSTSGCRWRSR